MSLTPDQNTRYARQVLLPEVGGTGQAKLLDTKILVVGAGGLGSPLLLYLAAAGIGHITIADDDTVALSNLQRQVLYDTPSVGQPKADKAGRRLTALNPDCNVTVIEDRITASNVHTHIQDMDLVIDCCDNFNARFTLSDACVRHKIPFVSAAVQGFDGMVAVLDPAQGGPCYRCFNPAPPPRESGCDDIGILGAMAGVIGSWQALTVIKLILGLETDIVGTLRIFDGLKGHMRTVRIPHDPDCNVCSHSAPIDD
jgi:adenylyltransferase/sulfurtransferase